MVNFGSTGLSALDIKAITAVLEKYPEVESAVLFGSRAKGNYQKASDIDLALFGEKLTQTTVNCIYGELEEETPLPYFFDVINYQSINNGNLKEHINRVGVTIYQK